MATQNVSSTPDFLTDDQGSVFLVVPQTISARLWIADHINKESFQPFYPAIAVEHYYIHTIIEGIQADGLGL
jgi:hypothetical protein